MSRISKKRRLLIVDAPGGPEPRTYLKMLPSYFIVKMILMLPSDPIKSKERISEVKRAGHSPYLIKSRSNLRKKIKEVAISFNAEGIFTLSERVVHDAAVVADSLGLPSNPPETRRALQNKDTQRRLLKQGGLQTPKCFKIMNEMDLEGAIKKVGFPAVLKPVTGIGSLSVYEVNAIEDLYQYYKTAMELYRKDDRVTARPIFLLESKLIGKRWHSDSRMGDHVSVESLVYKGNITHLAITDKFPLAYPFRETGDILPSTLDKAKQTELLVEAERSIRALGIKNGAIHTEIKLTDKEPIVIEVNGRIGGGVTEMLQLASEFNVIEQIARIYIGEQPSKINGFFGYSAFITPQPPAEDVRLTETPNVTELLNHPNVIDANLVFHKGAFPDWRLGTGSHLIRVFAFSEEREKVAKLGKYLIELNGFQFVPFQRKNILYKGL